ncbi:tRNA (N6-isopentenyl adenosine(37)-C2)-methylthiotransferase MiaB [Oceanithermus sp.]
MNEYDSHLVASELAAEGAIFVDSLEQANFVLVNTCAVRGKPVEKVKSLLGKLRKEKERRREPFLIGMMGCLASLEEGREIAEHFGVDVLLGAGAIHKIAEAVRSAGRYWDQGFYPELDEIIPQPPHSLSAYVTLIRGCDHHCTYCVVPRTRGPEISRHPDLILREVEGLLEAGVIEVTLLGQNVNSYGKNDPAYPDFADLIRQVAALGVRRLRFVTSHPMNFSDRIIEAIAETSAVGQYVHLPVQSGSDRILRRMAREYRRDYYLERVEKLRQALPDLVLTTDVIVGFPGETEEDFQQTLELYDQVGFDSAYMFIYSARPGTPSYERFSDMPREVKVERLERLIEKQKEWSLRRNQAWVGRSVEVLVRGPGREEDWALGHDQSNHPVLLPAASVPGPGLYRARIEQASPHMLFGQVEENLLVAEAS